jgi:hypothetical protein
MLRSLKFANLNLVSLFSYRVYLSENYKDIPYPGHIDHNFNFEISLGDSAVKIPLHSDQQGEIGFLNRLFFEQMNMKRMIKKLLQNMSKKQLQQQHIEFNHKLLLNC